MHDTAHDRILPTFGNYSPICDVLEQCVENARGHIDALTREAELMDDSLENAHGVVRKEVLAELCQTVFHVVGVAVSGIRERASSKRRSNQTRRWMYELKNVGHLG